MAICLWDTWICHALSNIEVCANASGNMSKHQPARKRLKKSTLAASTLTCCVFICTNLEQTRNTRPIGHFTMAGTLQVAKLWHAGFSYVQTSSKPCSNLKSMGPDDAFFFRPTPSWLPPGRYTRSIAAKRWIAITMQGCLLVDSHKSAGSGPVHSPVSGPIKKKPQTKNTSNQANKTHKTTTEPKLWGRTILKESSINFFFCARQL